MYYKSFKANTGREIGSLCFFCQNAVPGKHSGCEWSRSWQPVPGWEATPTILSIGTAGSIREDQSYCVKRCPKFNPDSAARWKSTDTSYRGLLKNDDGTCYYRG